MVRGAEIYDWFMAFRIERRGDCFKTLCRIASEMRADDRAERAGRRSWITPEDRIKANPSILGTVTNTSKKRK